MKREPVTFEEFANFIREWARVSAATQIALATQFERDLGVTGDDGVELLAATEKKFNVNFDLKAFELAENEFLFGPESTFLSGIWNLFKSSVPMIRSFTVGELYEVVVKERLRM